MPHETALLRSNSPQSKARDQAETTLLSEFIREFPPDVARLSLIRPRPGRYSGLRRVVWNRADRTSELDPFVDPKDRFHLNLKSQRNFKASFKLAAGCVGPETRQQSHRHALARHVPQARDRCFVCVCFCFCQGNEDVRASCQRALLKQEPAQAACHVAGAGLRLLGQGRRSGASTAMEHFERVCEKRLRAFWIVSERSGKTKPRGASCPSRYYGRGQRCCRAQALRFESRDFVKKNRPVE